MKKIINFITNSLFQRVCLICENECFSFVCKNCIKSIKFKEPSCPSCSTKTKKGEFCLKCKKKFSHQGVLVATDFNDKKIEKLIKQYKYKMVKELGVILGVFLFNFFNETNERNPILKKDGSNFNKNNSVITYIPLSRRRQKWRGFNQSELMARIISKKSGIPIFTEIIKTKNTKSQAKLSLKERRLNLKDSFQINNCCKLKSKNIIVVDDVLSTGSTIEELSKELKKCFPKEIWGLVLSKNQTKDQNS